MRVPRIAAILGIGAATLLLAGCWDRIELVVSAPFTSDYLREELRDEIRRAEPSLRRRVAIREVESPTDEVSVTPFTIDGIPAVPEMPRRSAVEDCIEWAIERNGELLIVAYPENDEARREEAQLFLGAGAVLIELAAPENFSRATDRLVEAGAGGPATVVLLLGEYSPQITHWLAGRSTEPAIVTEALFASSVVNLRNAGIRVAGAIVLDLVGTLGTVDNYKNESASEIYLSSVFFR